MHEDIGNQPVSAVVLAGPIGHGAHVGEAHPERPDRVMAAMAGLVDLDLGSDLARVDVVPAGDDDLLRVHSRAHLDHLERLAASGGGHIDPDTFVTADSWDTARLAAGAGLAVAAELSRQGDGLGVVIARPPGHHATRRQAMGFCLVNNVAVLAASLADAGERVLVVDWDVHHGNGTQDIFFDDPRVLYVSTHEWPLYPGTGAPDEVGSGAGVGTTVNLPVPAGATGDILRRALEAIAAPVVEAFAPDWVLVSAGFDAHRADPLAGLVLSDGDFAELAALAGSWAPAPGRLVVFLEGGYHLGAVRASMAATAGRLVGAGRLPVAPPTSGGRGLGHLEATARRRARALE